MIFNIRKIPLILIISFSFLTPLWMFGFDEVDSTVRFNLNVNFATPNNCEEQDFYLSLADGWATDGGCPGASNGNYYSNMKPGKKYILDVSGGDVDSYSLDFFTDPEFRLFIDSVESYRIDWDGFATSYSSNELYEVVLECKACTDATNIPAGYSTRLTSGELIWEVSLGHLTTGASAGRISFREFDITSSVFSPGALNYSHDSAEIEILPGGLQPLEQVYAPQALANIETITDGYTISFYPFTQVGAKTGTGCGGGGCYSVSGTPFIKYTIERLVPLDDTKLKLTRTRYEGAVATSWVTTAELAVDGTWDVKTQNQLRQVNTTNSTDAGGVRTEITEVRDDSFVLATRMQKEYKTFAGKERIWKIIEDPDVGAYVGGKYTTEYDYYIDANEEETYGLEKWTTFPDGNWVYNTYHLGAAGQAGKLHQVFRPVKDAPLTPSIDANLTRVKIFNWIADWNGSYTLLDNEEEKVNNVQVRYVDYSYTFSSIFDNKSIRVATRKDYYKKNDGGGPYFHTRVTARYRSDVDTSFANRLIYIKRADQSMEYHTYEEGLVTFNATSGQWEFDAASQSPDGWRLTTYYGSSNLTGGESFATIAGQDFYLIPKKSVKDVVIIDRRGFGVRTENHALDIASAGSFTFAQVSYTDFTYNDAGNVTKRVSDNGLTYEATWENGLRISETNDEGVVTDYTYDDLDRVTQIDRNTATVDTVVIPAVVTAFAYDSSGRLIKKEVGTASKITTEWDYSFGGRVMELKEFSTAASAYQLNTSFSYSNGGRTATVTNPGTAPEGGGTQVIENFLDGRIKSVTGTAVVARHFDFGVDIDGFKWGETRIGSPTSSRRTSAAVNWVGQVLKETQPTDDGGPDFTREYFYAPDNYPSGEGTGYLSRVTETDLADQYFQYNTLGQLIMSGVDVVDGANNNYTDLVVNSEDRISEQDGQFVYSSSAWWFQTENKVIGINSDGSASSASQVLQKTMARLTGFSGNVVSETWIYDAHNIEGNKIIGTTEINRVGKKREEKVTYPDSSTVEISTLGNGVLLNTVSAQGVTTNYEFDAYGLLFKTNDRRGDHVINYNSGTAIPSDQVNFGVTTEIYGYDSAGRLNEVTSRIDATSSTTAYTEYDIAGRVIHNWGSAVNPVHYVYDSTYGDLVEQHTFRANAPVGSSWVDPGTPDITKWVYGASTGFVSKKVDAALKEVIFSYNDRGQLERSTPARGAGMITDYVYDPNTAELTNINYPGGSPVNVSFGYTRLGQIKEVNDAIGQRTFSFRTSDFQVDSENLPAFYGASAQIDRGYYSTSGSGAYKGKPNWTKFMQGAATLADTTYGYEAASGRVDTVTSGTNTFDYHYMTNSNLVDQLKMGTNQYLVERVWDAQRNLLTSIDTGWDTVESYDSKAKYEYRYDDLGRRTDVAQTGSIFDRYGSGLVRRFGYNDRGELTSESSEIGSDPVLTGAMVPGRGYGYGFDSAGNRTSASVDGLGPSGYAPSATNPKYDFDRSTPGKIHVSGFASSSANVIARVEPNAPVAASRAGASDYFHAAVDSDNTTSANYDTVETTAAVPGATDTYSQDSTKKEFVAKSPETYAHDADGNLTSDGLWRYEYDAENRLVKMIMRSTGEGRPSTLTPRKRLEFTYDYVGRRVEKKVYTGMDEVSDTSGTLTTHLKFVYDGFNLIAELDGSADSVNRSFVWGLDESGTTQGAGGVGGLLMIVDGASKYLTAYDGSGNLTALLNEVDGTVAAAYEYGPFGEPLRSSGTYADANPFRFSTKYTDSETGLVYFGLRYYEPTTGRFINRDPIGEAGGLNLYGFVGNDPINRVDFLGLSFHEGNGTNPGSFTDHCAENPFDVRCISSVVDAKESLSGDTAIDTEFLEDWADFRLDQEYEDSLAENPDTINVYFEGHGVEKDPRIDLAQPTRYNPFIRFRYGEGDSKLIIIGSTIFVRSVVESLNKISEDSLGRHAIRILKARGLYIVENLRSGVTVGGAQPIFTSDGFTLTKSGDFVNGPGISSTILLPLGGYDFQGDGLGPLPQFVVLAHEIGHAYANAIGKHLTNANDPEGDVVHSGGSTPRNEIQALFLEEVIRRHHNLPARGPYESDSFDEFIVTP